MDTCLSAATDKDVRRFDWFCNLLAILSRPAVTLAFLRMGDALTLAQAALSASALVLGVLLAYADVICSKLCRDRRAAGALNKLASANLLLFPNICKVPVWLVAYVSLWMALSFGAMPVAAGSTCLTCGCSTKVFEVHCTSK